MGSIGNNLQEVKRRIASASISAGRDANKVTLLAVSKTFPAAAVREAHAVGQREFGENYVQEAQAKRAQLHALPLEWHLIGHLQSNKAELAAEVFDWVQSVDRAKLVTALARHRPELRAPLNVLIQVNIDDEASKHGCAPGQVAALAALIAAEPRLRLRGLMAIPAPHPESELRRAAYRRMATLLAELAQAHVQVDTLSMGMSDDYALAIAEGATMVRIGTALFGARGP